MKYFFNLAGAVYDPDVAGIDLPSLSDARVMVAQHAGELLRARPGLAWLGEELRVEVTDSNQLKLVTLIVLGVDAPAISSMASAAS